MTTYQELLEDAAHHLTDIGAAEAIEEGKLQASDFKDIDPQLAYCITAAALGLNAVHTLDRVFHDRFQQYGIDLG